MVSQQNNFSFDTVQVLNGLLNICEKEAEDISVVFLYSVCNVRVCTAPMLQVCVYWL